MTKRTYAAVLTCLALAGCGEGQASSSGSSTVTGGGASSKGAPATSAAPLAPFETTCGTSPLGKAHVAMESVAGPGGERLAVGVVEGKAPASGTTVVLLHQDKPEAMCGWRDYAQHLAARGHRVVMPDLCGYGESICDTPWSTQYRDQVTAVTTWAWKAPVKRLVLVGASMGGGHAVQAAAPARADAVVDLSGVPSYRGADIAADAPKVTVPLLVVMSKDDGEDQYAATRKAVDASPARPRQVRQSAGPHGWGLVVHEGVRGPELGAVTDWVEGRYPKG